MSDEYFRDMEKCHSQGQPEIVGLGYTKNTGTSCDSENLEKFILVCRLSTIHRGYGT